MQVKESGVQANSSLPSNETKTDEHLEKTKSTISLKKTSNDSTPMNIQLTPPKKNEEVEQKA